jgi:hypothetical protein
MPSVTPKQHRFFEMVKHSPAMQKKTGVSEKVADEFLQADKRAGLYQKPTNPLIPRK